MGFHSNDVSRQLLKNALSANKEYKSKSEDAASREDSKFFDLALKAMTTQMSYLEHNRVNHLMFKNVFESFQ